VRANKKEAAQLHARKEKLAEGLHFPDVLLAGFFNLINSQFYKTYANNKHNNIIKIKI